MSILRTLARDARERAKELRRIGLETLAQQEDARSESLDAAAWRVEAEELGIELDPVTGS